MVATKRRRVAGGPLLALLDTTAGRTTRRRLPSDIRPVVVDAKEALQDDTRRRTASSARPVLATGRPLDVASRPPFVEEP